MLIQEHIYNLYIQISASLYDIICNGFVSTVCAWVRSVTHRFLLYFCIRNIHQSFLALYYGNLSLKFRILSIKNLNGEGDCWWKFSLPSFPCCDLNLHVETKISSKGKMMRLLLRKWNIYVFCRREREKKLLGSLPDKKWPHPFRLCLRFPVWHGSVVNVEYVRLPFHLSTGNKGFPLELQTARQVAAWELHTCLPPKIFPAALLTRQSH